MRWCIPYVYQSSHVLDYDPTANFKPPSSFPPCVQNVVASVHHASKYRHDSYTRHIIKHAPQQGTGIW